MYTFLLYIHGIRDAYRHKQSTSMGNTFTKFFASFLAYGVANKKKSFSAVGHFAEGLAPAKGKIQWGYINKGYDIVIPLKYERAFSFKGGLTMVVLNSQYGYIDCTGQIKIPLNLSAAHSFEEECARDYGDI